MTHQLIEKVLDFMTKFNQPVNREHTVPTESVKSLRIKLLQEEYTELLTASVYEDSDYNTYLIETADALTDILYVLYGTYADFGISYVAYNADVWENILFSKNPKPNNTEDLIKCLRLGSLPCALSGLYDSFINNDFVSIQSSCWLIEYTIVTLSELYKFDLIKLFNEVHESNMTKLHNGKVVKDKNGKIIKGLDYKPADIKNILKESNLLK